MSQNYSLSRKNTYLFPELVLHEICDCLNVSELKAFRLVCVQWYFAARTHIQNRGQLALDIQDEKFTNFANSNQSGGYSPVRNVELTVCLSRGGCTCLACVARAEENYYTETGKHFRQFDYSTLETIVSKCTSGIKSFALFAEQNHSKINHEKLLLLEQFKILKELYIYDPFKLTQDSGIKAVFRRLTSVYLGFTCGNESFAANVFSECCYLKTLILGPSSISPDGEIRTGIVRILDALSDAMKINEYLKIETMNIIKPRFTWPRSWYDAASHTIIFSKLLELNLKLKVLDLSFAIDCREPNAYLPLMGEIQKLLDSQKDSLVKLVLPHFWRSSQSELKYLPHMKNLEELESNVNFHLPVMDLRSKLPVLTTVTIEFFHSHEIINRFREEYNCTSQFADQLTQNIPPCTTVTELNLSYLRNGEMLTGFNKIFPNVQSLTIDLECKDLQKLWRCWPKIKELNLAVTDTNNMNDPFYYIPRTDLHTELELSSKFHAALLGIPESDCEALLESSVPFLTLKIDNNYNLPSIRDFSELTHLTLDCNVACNIALMLGIFPITSLMEVYMENGQFTIDCVQYILSCRPNINRWEFKGICVLKMHYHAFENPRPKECIKWTISSSNNEKLQPIYAARNYCVSGSRFRPLPNIMYKIRLRSVNKYGRGRCLLWTLHVPPSPYVY